MSRESGWCLKCEKDGQVNGCICCLKPNADSGRGTTRSNPQQDAAQMAQHPIHYRLKRGFALLGDSKHDL